MATKTDRKWKRSMTLEEQIRLMTDAEIDMNARRGGPAAIAEKQRRAAEAQTAWANSVRAMGIAPPAPLDIGV